MLSERWMLLNFKNHVEAVFLVIQQTVVNRRVCTGWSSSESVQRFGSRLRKEVRTGSSCPTSRSWIQKSTSLGSNYSAFQMQSLNSSISCSGYGICQTLVSTSSKSGSRPSIKPGMDLPSVCASHRHGAS